MGSDLSIVNAARVSYGKQKDQLDDSDVKLIRYLAKHKHTSPFGHVFASFHVAAPIFVARQLVKHKFLRWNEISRRYVDYEPTFWSPRGWRGRPVDSKQGSSGEVKSQSTIDFAQRAALDTYQNLLKDGVAPEQARMILPQNMMTEWYWSGSLDAFADMCKLRCAKDTQYETQIVANQIDGIMLDLYPHSWSSLCGSE